MMEEWNTKLKFEVHIGVWEKKFLSFGLITDKCSDALKEVISDSVIEIADTDPNSDIWKMVKNYFKKVEDNKAKKTNVIDGIWLNYELKYHWFYDK